jgi:cytochrome b involved in lipid metabolism
MKAIIVLIVIAALGFAVWQLSQKAPAERAAEVAAQPAEQTTEKTYTLAQVAEHKDVASCLTAIRGTVYDLTAWISKHPGGDKNILKLCGIDGTSAFEGKHGGQENPENALKGFAVGSLAQ